MLKGVGKSTLANAVATRVNEFSLQNFGKCIAIVLPMDGFHLSRAELKALGSQDESKYTYEELLARRGSPWTFDVEVIPQFYVNLLITVNY